MTEEELPQGENSLVKKKNLNPRFDGGSGSGRGSGATLEAFVSVKASCSP